MSNKNIPEGWGQNKGVPDSWKKGNAIPENWGKQSSNPSSNSTSGGDKTNTAGNAVDHAKYNNATEKAALAKKKAGAAISGLKGKAAAFAAERKKVDDSNASVAEVIEDINNVVEEDYTTTEAADNVEETAESASFDELYEKAMNTDVDEGTSDAEIISEEDIVESYNEETVNEVKTPVASSFATPTPAQTITQEPTPSQYDFEEKKKSPAIIVLVGVIAIVLVGIGILGYMLLIKNKDNKDSDKSSNNEVITTTTEEISSQATTASTQETTSEILTTPPKTTTEASVNISKEEIETAKEKAVADLRNDLSNVYSNNHVSIPQLTVTTDYDINDDDIPELIVSYMGISGDTQYHIFYYDNSMFVKLKDCWGGLYILEDRHLICEKRYGGGQGSYYYELSNDYKINKIDEINTFPEQGGTAYFRNGQRIDASEYYVAINYYDGNYSVLMRIPQS